MPSLASRLGRRSPPAEPFVPAGDPARRGELGADLELLDREVMPAFRRLDAAAARGQNAFRLERLTLILGGAVATSLGAVQASVGGGEAPLAIAQAALAGGLSVVAFRARSRSAQQEYLTSRLKAERLRAEYFLFLMRRDPYAADGTRLRALRARVDELEAGEAAP